jgi:hypothetical protein
MRSCLLTREVAKPRISAIAFAPDEMLILFGLSSATFSGAWFLQRVLRISTE